MNHQLRLSDTFRLSPEAVTETFLVLGQRGSGKTNTAAVIAEELFGVGAPFAVLTPIDVWWGLKAAANGRDPGLPIYIFGGEHGDLPLTPENGRLMADILIDTRISCVICTQGFSGGERARFVRDFALRLLSKNRQPLHLIVEEADAFIPQRPYKGEEEMLGAMDRLIRWGRSPSAIGGTFITQRSAKINKDVSTQCSVLVAHRTAGPQDIDAIKEWFKHHSDPEKQRQVLGEIASLPKGMAFVYSPAWLEHFGKHQIRRRTTYDSAATPKLGEKRIEPTAAIVDLSVLQAKMADTIAKAKADDPRELNRTILSLRQEIVALKKVPPKPTDAPKSKDDVSWVAENRRLQKQVVHLHSILKKIQLATLDYMKTDIPISPPALPPPDPRIPQLPVRLIPEDTRPRMVRNTPLEPQASASEQKLLIVLAMYPSGKTVKELAVISGYARAGRFNNLLGGLRSKEWVKRGEPVQITTAGLEALGPYEPLPTGADLQNYWLRKLTESEARVLRPLLDVYPEGLSRDELAQRSMYEVAGRFNNILGRLRTLEIVQRGSPIRASAILFE